MSRSDGGWPRRLTIASRVLSVAVTALALVVMAGWVLDAPALTRIRPDLPAMNPLTAACLAVMALAVWLLSTGAHGLKGRGCAALVALVATFRIVEAPLGSPVTNALFAAWRQRPEWTPMAQGTAVALLLIGSALGVMDGKGTRARAWAQALLVGAVAPALLSLALAAFGAPFQTPIPFLQPMAIPTAFSLVMLVCAGLIVRPRWGVMEVVTGDSIGSAVFRFMVPVVVVVPVALAGLNLLAQEHGLLDAEQSAALLATFTTMMLVTGLWFVAKGVRRAEAERRRIEHELAESQQRLDMVLRSVGVGVWDWDIVADAVTFDETVKDQWQVDHFGPVSMQEVVDHLHPEDRMRAIGRVRRALREGHEYSTSYRVQRADGSVRVLGARGYVTHDRDRRPLRLTGVNWDVTLQHEAEAARAHAQLQQLELKDQFISHVSHELRSPLTVIFSFVEILLDGLAGEINEQQREFLEIAQRNANQLRQMIDDLLEVTRAQTGKLVVHPCRMTIAREIEATLEGLRPQAAARHLTLTSDLPEHLPTVLADPYRVRQVLVNLVDNAIKFTPEGGTIRITAGVGGKDGLIVSVADTGPGIPAAEREDIFRQLYQLDLGAPTARKGLGLGLFICRQLVTRMGGRIWVESAVSQGSQFSFTLPLYSPASAIAPLLTPENVAAGSFCLVCVTFEPSPRRSWSEKDDHVLAGAVEVIRSCTLPDRDVVLPRLGVVDDRETICVLASGGREAAATLERRIQGQLSRSDGLQSSRLTWIIGTLALGPAGMTDQDADRLAGALVTEIETALDQMEPGRNAA